MNTVFGSLLREARTRKGISQRDLAETLGFSSPYISDIEHGRRHPFSDDTLVKLSPMLGVSLERLRHAAQVSRGVFHLPASTARHNEVASVLVGRWTGLKPTQLEEILKAVS